MDPEDQARNDLGRGTSRDGVGDTPAPRPRVQGERWLRSVLEHSSEITSIVDPDGTLRYASPAFERVLGYDPEEAIGTNVLGNVHPEDLQHVLEETEKALSEGGVTTNKAEYRFRHKNGTWIWLESLGTYLLDDPEVGGVVVSSRDVSARKEAEEALRRAEERFRPLVQNSSDVVTLLDTEGTVSYDSPSIERTLGYSVTERVGRSAFELVHDADADRARNLFAESLRSPGIPLSAELRMRHKDGSYRSVEATASNLLGDPGVRGIVINWRDVTGRKAEKALKEAEERYRTLVEQIPAVTYIDRADGSDMPVYTSPQIKGMLGYSPKEWLDGRLWLERLHPEDRERVLAADERFETGTDVKFDEEYRLIARDGTVVWVREEAVPVRDAEDETLFWQGVIYDVTERHRAGAALEESEERFRSAFEDAPIGVAVVGLDGRHLRVNRALCEMLGYTEEELLSKTSSEVTHPEDREMTTARMERLLVEDGSKCTIEKRYVRSDGRPIWCMLSVSLVRDAEGSSGHFVCHYQDVTRRKEMEEALRRSEARYRTVVEAQTELLCRFSPDLTLTFVNHAYCRYFRREPEELIGSRFLEQIPQEHHAYYEGALRRLSPEDPTSTVEERVFAPGGARWLQWTDTAIFDAEGRAIEYQSVGRDVTDRKEAEERLKEAESRYRTLVENVPPVIYMQKPSEGVGAAAYEVTYMSPRVEDVIGYPAQWFMEDAGFWHRLIHPDDLEAVLRENERTDASGADFAQEYRMFHRNGRPVWVRDEAVLVGGAQGSSSYWQGVISDISARKLLEERVEYQALHDSLTGLPNRRLLIDRLGQALERTRRQCERRVGVLFLDLDDFKVVNDSLGHEAGDLLLVVVAQRLRRCLRPEDTLARFGGDEFVVLLEDIEQPEEAVRVAKRITEELRRPFHLEGHEIFASASIGVSLGTARTKSSEELLRDADTAMYQAKKDGSGYRMFDPTMYERVVQRLELENDLRRAVEQEELVVLYQPIFDFGSQGVWGVEALLRWDHPQRGLLSPSQFVSVAEETGLIIPIGSWVLQEACRQVKVWQQLYPRGAPLGVIVNLSAKQLRHPGCVETIEAALAKSGLAAESLSLDVTETAFIDALEAGDSLVLKRIQALGVRISIDDFGMGYSSLSYLKRLPADALKIDKSFVKGFGEDPQDTAIVRMVIDVAHTLDLKVVAEGVETWAQAALLAEMGCDMAQGHHFAQPLSPAATSKLLAG